MDSYKVFDHVIEYLETIVTNAEEIDYNAISKIAGCPAPLFQRIFVFITGATITEYVRRRRLSLAGLAVKHSNDKIIDIVLRFGFNSHVSFTRAFKEHHKSSPSEVRNNNARLYDYPPLSFKNMRIIGGKQIMAELKKIEYVECTARKVMGMMKRTYFQKAGEECWGAAFKQGVFDHLKAIDNWVCKDIEEYIGLGHMSKFEGQDHFQYIIGKYIECDAPIPEDLYSEDVPAGTIAKIWIESDTLDNIIDCAYLLCSETIEKTGYKIDYKNFYWCDIYTYERYCTPLEKGKKIILDYILPVVKAES